MLTTTDNPFNPWTNFDSWFDWDVSYGYNTTTYLARLVEAFTSSSDLTEEEAEAYAIADIVDKNITGNYVFVTKPSETEEIL